MSGRKANGGLAGRIARLFARALPERVRGRYREEWLADLAGAGELGLSRASILLGALATVVSIDRDSPVVLGIPVSVEAVRRARWAAACLVSSVILLVGLWWNGGYEFDGSPEAAGPAWLGRGIGAVAAVLAAVGAWQTLRALFIGVEAYGAKRVLLTGLGGLACLLGLGTTLIIPFVGMLYGFIGLVAALVLAAGGPRGAVASDPLPALRRLLLALPFLGAALLMQVAVLLHVFVWNPLAKLPGMTLDEIYGAMRIAGEKPSDAVTIVFVGLSTAAILAPVALAATRAMAGPRSTRRIVVLGLLSIVVAGWSEFWLGFGMGMGIADTFGTDGGDAAVTGRYLSMIGQFALVAATFAGIAPTRRRRYRDLTASGAGFSGRPAAGPPAGALT